MKKEDKEIDELAKVFAEKHKTQITASQAQNKFPQWPKKPKTADPNVPPLGQFGWVTVTSNIPLPYIFRGDVKFVSTRILEGELLQKIYHHLDEQIMNCFEVKTYQMTTPEAKLFNEINFQHCDSRFGKQEFSAKDLLVSLEDAIEMYDFIHTCFRTFITKVPVPTDRCGFVKIDKQSLVPYSVFAQTHYVPLFYFEGDCEYLYSKKIEMTGWSLAYLKLLCKMQGLRNSLFSGDCCTVVPLDEIKLLFHPGTTFEEFWPLEDRPIMLVADRKFKQIKWVRDAKDKTTSGVTKENVNNSTSYSGNDTSVPVVSNSGGTITNFYSNGNIPNGSCVGNTPVTPHNNSSSTFLNGNVSNASVPPTNRNIPSTTYNSSIPVSSCNGNVPINSYSGSITNSSSNGIVSNTSSMGSASVPTYNNAIPQAFPNGIIPNTSSTPTSCNGNITSTSCNGNILASSYNRSISNQSWDGNVLKTLCNGSVSETIYNKNISTASSNGKVSNISSIERATYNTISNTPSNGTVYKNVSNTPCNGNLAKYIVTKTTVLDNQGANLSVPDAQNLYQSHSYAQNVHVLNNNIPHTQNQPVFNNVSNNSAGAPTVAPALSHVRNFRNTSPPTSVLYKLAPHEPSPLVPPRSGRIVTIADEDYYDNQSAYKLFQTVLENKNVTCINMYPNNVDKLLITLHMFIDAVFGQTVTIKSVVDALIVMGIDLYEPNRQQMMILYRNGICRMYSYERTFLLSFYAVVERIPNLKMMLKR